MAEPIKIQAKSNGDITDIRMMLNHVMETGQRKDPAGKLVPAHFIQSMTVEVGGKKVIDGQIGTSVAKNPVLSFKVKGAKKGDKVVVGWIDNKGEKRSDETTVA